MVPSPAIIRGSRLAMATRAASRFRDCSRDSKACRVFYNATCCAGTCVNVHLDDNNCGLCGKKCGYMEACCDGECKNLSMDPSNCGRCGNLCPDSSCQFGLCGYY
ncbi:hypothetical protein L7F22_050597 [Adiantum nelumboides]|nr:hypothetical protein [Adiantum nelumboides]